MDQNHSENDLLLMKLLLMNTIAKVYKEQVSWHYYWGLDNSPLVITSYMCVRLRDTTLELNLPFDM